jgi:DNA polymerase sigma
MIQQQEFVSIHPVIPAAALNAMTEERKRAILAVRDRVIIILRAHFDASMHALDLYGSMANGFACRFSDLDLCLELRRGQMPVGKETSCLRAVDVTSLGLVRL